MDTPWFQRIELAHHDARSERTTWAEASVERQLAAILAADVTGYSRLMGADEVDTLAALKARRREIVDPAIAQHHGWIVMTTGHGVLVEFANAVDAATCAVAVQEKMAERAVEKTEPRVRFRGGINIGDIIIDGGDILAMMLTLRLASRPNVSQVAYICRTIPIGRCEERRRTRSTILEKNC